MANTSKVEKARQPFNKSIESEESPAIKRKTSRPSASDSTVTNEEVLTTWSKTITYEKMLCRICQKAAESCQCPENFQIKVFSKV